MDCAGDPGKVNGTGVKVSVKTACKMGSSGDHDENAKRLMRKFLKDVKPGISDEELNKLQVVLDKNELFRPVHLANLSNNFIRP